MNFVDIVLLLALGLAAFRGFRQGALAQVTAFGGAVLGLVIGAVAAPRLATLVVDMPGLGLSLMTLALLLIFIFGLQAIGLAIGLRLKRAAETVGAGPVDRTAGIAVGITGLLLTVWLLGSALIQGPSDALARQLQQSTIVAALDQALPPPPNVFGQVGNYLNRQGFPQVFSGLGGGTIAPPLPPPGQGAVSTAAAAGQPSTVQVEAIGCGGITFGSGFVTRPGFIVTNAHVVAGGQTLQVNDTTGSHNAVAIYVDSDLDLAVLSAPDTQAPPIAFVVTPSQRGIEGATLGFPGGQSELAVEPAIVRARGEAVGRNIYGTGLVTREILTLGSAVRQGDSGGPFVTSDGQVGGVVFAAAASRPGTGYALTAEAVRPGIDAAIAANTPASTGNCRF